MSARMFYDCGSKKLGIGCVRILGPIEVAVAHATSDHHGSHLREPRPHALGRVGHCLYPRISAAEKILFEDKERLNCLDLAIAILEGKILVVKSLPDRIF